jgi:catechol 2,3-dioxygenase-like lactoylglutathione lyase family enzyme
MTMDTSEPRPGTFASAAMPKTELAFCSELEATPTARVPDLAADVVRPAELAHIVFLTNRIDAMRQWWRAVLGGAAMMTGKEMEFITFDDEHHRVAIFQRDRLKEKTEAVDTAGLHHVAFTYGSLADLVATYRRLKAQGIAPVRTIHHGITVSNYYLDPDNNRVELQVNAFASKQKLNAWLAGRGFNDNPIGVLFDFDELVRRFDAGEDTETLLRPLEAATERA